MTLFLASFSFAFAFEFRRDRGVAPFGHALTRLLGQASNIFVILGAHSNLYHRAPRMPFYLGFLGHPRTLGQLLTYVNKAVQRRLTDRSLVINVSTMKNGGRDNGDVEIVEHRVDGAIMYEVRQRGYLIAFGSSADIACAIAAALEVAR